MSSDSSDDEIDIFKDRSKLKGKSTTESLRVAVLKKDMASAVATSEETKGDLTLLVETIEELNEGIDVGDTHAVCPPVGEKDRKEPGLSLLLDGEDDIFKLCMTPSDGFQSINQDANIPQSPSKKRKTNDQNEEKDVATPSKIQRGAETATDTDESEYSTEEYMSEQQPLEYHQNNIMLRKELKKELKDDKFVALDDQVEDDIISITSSEDPKESKDYKVSAFDDHVVDEITSIYGSEEHDETTERPPYTGQGKVIEMDREEAASEMRAKISTVTMIEIFPKNYKGRDSPFVVTKNGTQLTINHCADAVTASSIEGDTDISHANSVLKLDLISQRDQDAPLTPLEVNCGGVKYSNYLQMTMNISAEKRIPVLVKRRGRVNLF